MEKESHNGDMTPEEYKEELKSMKDMDAQDQLQEIDFDDHEDVLRNEPFDDGSLADFEGEQEDTKRSDWEESNKIF